VLAIVGALVAGYYFAMRPVTLRIRRPGQQRRPQSRQNLTQASTTSETAWSGCARCRPMARWRAPVCSEKARPTSPSSGATRCAEECAGRGNAAQERRGAVVPPAVKIKGKKSAPAITKIGQLTGRRIGVVGRTDANINLLKVILRQYGVDPAKVEIVQFPPTRPPRPFVTRRRTLISPPARSTARSRPTRSPPPRATAHAEIPRDRFGRGDRAESSRLRGLRNPGRNIWQCAEPAEEEIKTISFSHHIVARRGIAESTIAIFTRQLFAIRQTLKNEFPLAAKIETPIPTRTQRSRSSGAAAFVDGEEKTFLDRYSDYIWWSLMALSAMGSAGAWFAGALKKMSAA